MKKQLAEKHELEILLKRIGIYPPAYDRLRKRSNFRSDPALVEAWWWWSLVEDWPEKRRGLFVYRLEQGDQPPCDYLTLARIWPQVTEAQRADIRELRWRMRSPYQMSVWFAEDIPEFAPEVFAAYLALFKVAPEELGY